MYDVTTSRPSQHFMIAELVRVKRSRRPQTAIAGQAKTRVVCEPLKRRSLSSEGRSASLPRTWVAFAPNRLNAHNPESYTRI